MSALDDIIKNSKELSSLPEIYIRVSELLDDEKSTSDQIGAVVQSDPALTARILKVVNSSYYGFPSEIATISQAVSILGRNPLRQLLMGTVLGGVFSRISNDVFLMDEFWQHSVQTAVIAKYCYEHIVSKRQSDEIFIAGLLHDIGCLIIAHQLPEIATKIQRQVDSSDANIIAVEEELLGFNHSQVADAIMQQWGLPSVLRSCALHHHSPQEAGDYLIQAWIIHIANQLSHIPLSTDDNDVLTQLEKITGWETSGLKKEHIVEAYHHASEQFNMVLDSLGL